MKATSDMLIEALADALTGTSEESEILRKEVKEAIAERDRMNAEANRP